MRKGRHRIRIPLIVALLSILRAPAAGADAILLRPGFQQILERTGVTRLAVGNPEIVEAQPLSKGDGVLLVGKKAGETDLVVWEKGNRTAWKVTVREDEKESVFEETRAVAAIFPDLSVKEAGRQVIVAGTVPSPSDKRLLEDFARARPNVHLRLSLPEEKRVLLAYDLKILEIGKGASTQLGVKWPDTVSGKGSFSSGGGEGTALRLAADFEAQLNLLMADGRARVLANPRLVCESGQSANFLAGGEIPIVIVTPESRKVDWKTYGIILKLEPVMDQGNTIRTRITAEISTVDHGSGKSDVPGFITRRITTFFSIPPGGTVMLSGLVKNEMARDVAKVPLLGQIPVLGELFKSRNFRENQSELAIFITPTEVTDDAREEAAAWHTRMEKSKDEMRFRLID